MQSKLTLFLLFCCMFLFNTWTQFQCLKFLHSLNDYADSHQNSTRGMYGSGSGGRGGGRQGGPHSNSNGSTILGDGKSRTGSGRSASMQPSTPSSSQLIKDSGQGLPQLTHRKTKSSKQQQQQPSCPSEELQNLGAAVLSQPHRGHSMEDQDYNRLLIAMDKDLDRPESPAINAFTEQSVPQPSQNKGNMG